MNQSVAVGDEHGTGTTLSSRHIFTTKKCVVQVSFEWLLQQGVSKWEFE